MLDNLIIIVKKSIELYFKKYFWKSYSQNGEDMILRRLFNNHKKGFYVDVGAHHPKRFSNTFFFYKKGWNGINIDAMPGSMNSFNRIRPKDINLEIPVSNEQAKIKYYIFNDPALNGFSKPLTKERNNAHDDYYVVDEVMLQTQLLTNILDDYLPEGTLISFLTIDVEGLDFEVLQSIDFQKYQPKVILVELLDLNIEEIKNNKVNILLEENGYGLQYKTVNTAFYLKI